MKETTNLRTSIVVAVALTLVCFFSGAAMAANKLIVKDSAGETDKFVVTDKGYVGIGSTNPSVALDLVAPAGQSRIVIQTVGTSNIGGGGFIGLHNNDITVNSSLPRKGDRIGFHLFGTKTSTGTIWTAGGFQVYAEDNWTSTSFPTYFVFETAKNGGTSKYERFRISADGNIGISTNAPTQQLEINGGVRLNPTTIVGSNPSQPTTKPVCDNSAISVNTVRGTLWFTKDGGVGGADALDVCAKDGSGNYAWRKIY